MREFTKTVQQGNRMFGLQESDANNWLKQKLGANIISARLRQIWPPLLSDKTEKTGLLLQREHW